MYMLITQLSTCSLCMVMLNFCLHIYGYVCVYSCVCSIANQVVEKMVLWGQQYVNTYAITELSTISEASASEQAIAIVTTKVPTIATREQLSVANLKLDRIAFSDSEVKSVSIVLTEAGPKTSDQLAINQLIDTNMDRGILSYTDVAQICLSLFQEKYEKLKQLLNGMKT